MEKPMHLLKAIEQFHKDVDEFKKYWMEGVVNTPDQFPIELDSEAEWAEMFFSFLQTKQN